MADSSDTFWSSNWERPLKSLLSEVLSLTRGNVGADLISKKKLSQKTPILLHLQIFNKNAQIHID